MPFYHKPVFFIIGRPRSGTTLLSTLLDAHPEVILPPESRIIMQLYRKYRKRKTWKEYQIDEFLDDLYAIRKFDSWFIDRGLLKQNLTQALPNINFQEIINLIYISYNSLFEKEEIKILGDKNPHYCFYPEKLHSIFPEAKFIDLKRDYRDNVMSLLNYDFEAPWVSLLAYRWKMASRKMHALKKKIPQQVLSLRYEDFVKQPAHHLKNISTFLDISYQPDILNFYKQKDEFYNKYPPEILDTYFSSLFSPINADKAYLWKKKLKDDYVKVCDYVVGNWAETRGYERKYCKVGITIRLKCLPGIFYALFMYYRRMAIEKLPYVIKRKLKHRKPLFTGKNLISKHLASKNQ